MLHPRSPQGVPSGLGWVVGGLKNHDLDAGVYSSQLVSLGAGFVHRVKPGGVPFSVTDNLHQILPGVIFRRAHLSVDGFAASDIYLIWVAHFLYPID